MNTFHFKQDYTYLLYFLTGLCAVSIIWFEFKHKTTLFRGSNIISNAYYKALLASFILGFSVAIIFIIPPIILTQYYSIGTISMICFITPLSMVFTSRLSHKAMDKYGINNVYWAGFVFMAIGLVMMLLHNIPLMLVALFLFGVGCGLLQPAFMVFLFESTKVAYHSLGNSLSRVLSNAGIAIGSSTIAILISRGNLNYSTNIIYLIPFFIIFIGVPIFEFFLKNKEIP